MSSSADQTSRKVVRTRSKSDSNNFIKECRVRRSILSTSVGTDRATSLWMSARAARIRGIPASLQSRLMVSKCDAVLSGGGIPNQELKL